MAALTDFEAHKSGLTDPSQRLTWVATTFGITGRAMDAWVVRTPTNTAPTTAVVPAQSTGVLGFTDAGTGSLYPVSGEGSVTLTTAGFDAGTVVWCDRLSHQGGLSATVTTAQTTNLPTAALTRYTTGAGVWAMLTIYSQIGATGTTVTMSYTDQGGTTGNTSLATTFGGTGFREGGRGILIPLASGDTGVRAVASVTVLATTGTAGNFGVTLLKPLWAHPLATAGRPELSTLWTSMSCIPEVLDGACLVPLLFLSGPGQAIITTNLAEVT